MPEASCAARSAATCKRCLCHTTVWKELLHESGATTVVDAEQKRKLSPMLERCTHDSNIC